MKRSWTNVWVALLGASLLASVPACTGDVDGGPELGKKGDGNSPPLDHPPVDPGLLPVASRGANRLSIAQLRASFPIAFGFEADGTTPITWHDGTAEGFERYASSLGEPDYIEVTEENLDPSPMYAKFMDDAARDVCARVLVADTAKTDASKRVLMRLASDTDTVATNPTAIDQNLRYLSLRLFGEKLADDDVTTIAGLRTVFDSTAKESAGGSSPAAADVKAGWKAVCVAMVVAPEFHVY